jgi:AcrR family transcriptional regulator
LEAAFDLLAESGPSAVTVTGVCKHAGLTARYFYEHFANRDRLLDAMISAEADLIIATARTAALDAGDDPRVRGAAGVRALLDVLEGDPRAVRITRERGRDEVVLRMRAELTVRLTAAFVENLDVMWPELTGQPDRIQLASALAMGGVVQLLALWLEGNTQMSREELVRIIVDFTIATGALVMAPLDEQRP